MKSKKGIQKLLSIALAILMMVPVLSALAAGETTVRGAVITNPNTNERLNLREGPSTKSGSLGRYYNGVYVEVLGIEGEWAKVRVGGEPSQYAIGYMLASYLTMDASPEAVPSGMTKALTRLVSSKEPQLRDSPKSGSKVLHTFGEGISAVVLGEVGDYSHIYIAGQYGYMKRDFLKVSSSTPYQPAVPGVLQSYEFGIIHNSGDSRGTPLVSSPYVESSVLETLPNGTTVQIGGASGAWTQATHNGNTGFVLSGDLLSDADDAALVSADKLNYIDTDSQNPLDLYAFPSPGAAKLDTYYTNSRIQMTILSRAGAYWRVEMDEGKIGYVLPDMKSYQFGTNSKPEDGRQFGIVIVPDPTTRLNVRASASASSSIRDKIYGGMQVEILGRSDGSPGWYKIGFGNGKTGYVQQSFVSLIKVIGADKDWVK